MLVVLGVFPELEDQIVRVHDLFPHITDHVKLNQPARETGMFTTFNLASTCNVSGIPQNHRLNVHHNRLLTKALKNTQSAAAYRFIATVIISFVEGEIADHSGNYL